MRLLHRRGKQPDPPQEVRLILLIPADGQPLSFRIKMMPAKTSVLVAFVPAKELETYL